MLANPLHANLRIERKDQPTHTCPKVYQPIMVVYNFDYLIYQPTNQQYISTNQQYINQTTIVFQFVCLLFLSPAAAANISTVQSRPPWPPYQHMLIWWIYQFAHIGHVNKCANALYKICNMYEQYEHV